MLNKRPPKHGRQTTAGMGVLPRNGNGQSGNQPNRANNARRGDTKKAPPVEARYIHHRPWDIRLHDKLRSWAMTAWDWSPQNQKWIRWRRLRAWIVGIYPRARTFLPAILWGGFVKPAEAEFRARACSDCKVRRELLPAKPIAEGGIVRLHCISCRCPNWPLSRTASVTYPNPDDLTQLVVRPGPKAWLILAKCPENRWNNPASTWEDDYVKQKEATNVETIKEEDPVLDDDAVVDDAGGDCGCAGPKPSGVQSDG